MTRYAIVTSKHTLDQVQNYLPRNYTAEVANSNRVIIAGEDDHGWTMDKYVLPRLASGLIVAREIESSQITHLYDNEIAIVPCLINQVRLIVWKTHETEEEDA